MNVLLIGSGGREHALAWTLAASPEVTRLYCAPGNAGIAQECECVPIAATDLDGLVKFAKEHRIDFAVIGPEAPLVAGLWDRFEAAGIRALGPSAAGAQLEASKGFTKALCAERGIPTARFARFTSSAEAQAYCDAQPLPIVIKADGLAQGKGVIIAETRAEASEAITAMFGGTFGDAAQSIVIEEFLEGEEASFFVLTDGKHILPLASAQDHKRAFDGDTGPNTGGMGAYSPAPVLTDPVARKTIEQIIRPTLAALAERGTPYMGVLYAGLMIRDGEPKLIEYNCRFGDPECQVLMMRLKSDLAAALVAARDGVLDRFDLRWHDEAALTVVMAARGYPGTYAKGSAIGGLDAAAARPEVKIFHAATRRDGDHILADGGRVLGVTALGSDTAAARARAYAAIGDIDWPEGFCRRDIGWRALERGDG
jgi:phosphoribosylamine--glycine ligase